MLEHFRVLGISEQKANICKYIECKFHNQNVSLLFTCYLYLHLINIRFFDYPDSRLFGLFTEVPMSLDNRGLTVVSFSDQFK